MAGAPVRRLLRGIVGAVFALMPLAAAAEEAVNVGGALALLNKPASARAAIVLIPGGDGALGVRPDGTFTGLSNNQLVRTRKSYLGYGIATLTVDQGVDIAAAVTFMRKFSKSVVVAGTSRGTLRVAGSLAARPSGLVLASGFLDSVRSAVGSPDALPRTLVIHHRQDGCQFTPPSAVEPFKAWGGARVRVVWMDGGSNVGNPCQAAAYHGFNGLDGRVVAAIAQFAGWSR